MPGSSGNSSRRSTRSRLFDRARAPRFVRPRRWRHACRGLLADCTPPGGLRAARLARIDLLPHQLEPALAVVRGRGSRVLLADDVGLGKTIQAGLIVAELQARGQADRVLVVTPSGLRDQWRAELADRFAIAAAVVDFREIRRRSLTVPVGLNPWITTPIAITSIDYVKRPEVLQSVRACRWDVVVVDEAHGAGRDSDRLAAVSALAARAALRRAAHGDAAQRRPSRVRVAVRHRRARRSAAGVPAHESRGEPRRGPSRAPACGADQRRRIAHARASRGLHARRQVRTRLRATRAWRSRSCTSARSRAPGRSS